MNGKVGQVAQLEPRQPSPLGPQHMVLLHN